MSRYNKEFFEKLKELILKAQQGDRDSYQQFLTELYPFVTMLVSRKVGILADKDDVAQEVLMGIHKSLATFRPDGSIRAWVIGITKFKICDYFRKYERKINDLSFDEEIYVTDEEDPANRIIEEQDKALLWDAIHEMPEKLKSVLIQAKLEGQSYQEISKREGISEAALRKRFSRAYRHLAETMRLKMEQEFGEI